LVAVPKPPDGFEPDGLDDPGKWEDGTLEISEGYLYYPIYSALEDFIKDGDLGSSISINGTVDGLLFITFENDIMFDGDSAYIRKEALPVLDILAESMRGMDDHIGEIRILGHTNRLVESRPNNIAADRMLSSDRATNVLIHLQETGIIEGRKLKSMGMGEWFPVAPLFPESNARKNRRVEILIMQDEMVAKSLSEIYEEVGRNILSYD